jgi:hypothetical protein
MAVTGIKVIGGGLARPEPDAREIAEQKEV